MDSVTQIALGAAIGGAVAGRKVGWRAAVAGGICGTLPDLDVFVPLGDPVSDFTYHRSVTHSLFVLALAAPLVAEIIMRLQRNAREHWKAWYTLAFLCLLTHPLLDSFTVYGTQIFWPFDPTPVGWSTIFIIDPAYTLPLVIGVICALSMSRNTTAGHRVNIAGLVLSTAYLGWTVVAKHQANAAAEQAMERAGLTDARYMTIAGPFTSLFWRIVAVDNSHYHNAYYSILDGDTAEMTFTPHPRGLELLEGLDSDWATGRLQWFTKGFYTVKRRNKDVIFSDLRMGFEPNYVFTFKIGTISNPHTKPLHTSERVPVSQDTSGLSWVWQRIWSADAPSRP